jgi:endonuclease YncB( thermonuclease family)
MRSTPFALVFLAVAFPAAAADITGRASVIDGDTIEIHGTRIRLHGIDAPESAQLCIGADERPWRCGQRAALALADHIRVRTVSCERRDRDQFGRVIAVCFSGGADLNAWMVAEGWAVAYRRYAQDYVALEDEAKTAPKGIWASRFVMPWDWRRGEWIVQRAPVSQQSESCTIKGNISGKGERIYHVPGGRWYGQTVIDTATGERWFCTEDEARAAGWRRSRQ